MATLKEILHFCVSKALITKEDAGIIISRDIIGVNDWGTSGWPGSGQYPLLHLICNEVSPNLGEDCPFLIKARELIKLGATPDIFDKFTCSPLHYAASEGKERLVKMLVRAGASPDLLSGALAEQCTPLEYGILRSYQNEYHELIRYLHKKTSINERLKRSAEEDFKDAIERWEEGNDLVQRINILMELKLVTFAPLAPFVSECSEFDQGCWIRVVREPEEELKRLYKRATLSEQQLAREDRKTRYSSATFVKSNMPVALFQNATGYAGFIIRRLDRPIDYWYDGYIEVITDGCAFDDPAHFDNGQRSGQYWKVSENTIQTALEEKLNLNIQEFRRNQLDEFGVIEQVHWQDQYFQFKWNEGIFRYGKDDIVGIYVDPDNKKSASSALSLRQSLRQRFSLSVPFYHYQSNGSCRIVASEDLRKRYNLNFDGSSIIVLSGQRNSLLGRGGSASVCFPAEVSLSAPKGRGNGYHPA